MKAALIFPVLLCVGAYAQLPTPCQSPFQWEARQLLFDRERNYSVYAKTSYDELGQRMRRIEERIEGSDLEYLDILHLYKQNKEYRLDIKTRKCNVTAPRHPWRPYGVPTGSTFQGGALLGVAGNPRESLDVNNFSGKLSTNESFAGVVTALGCVPIQLDYIFTDGIEHNRFFNVTLGIRDSSVFNPPPECTS